MRMVRMYAFIYEIQIQDFLKMLIGTRFSYSAVHHGYHLKSNLTVAVTSQYHKVTGVITRKQKWGERWGTRGGGVSIKKGISVCGPPACNRKLFIRKKTGKSFPFVCGSHRVI
jgi:hypothetical protein